MAGTPPGGGAVGDPYILRPDGTKYKFDGTAGSTYNYASDSTIKVAFRVATVPRTTNGDTLIDQVTVQYTPLIGTKVSVVVGLTTATVNGAALVKGGAVLPFVTGSAKYWVGAGGEDRIDIVYGNWKVAIIQDPGTNLALHGGGPLFNVRHLGLFVDAMPSGMNLLNCIYLSGGPGISVLPFLISL